MDQQAGIRITDAQRTIIPATQTLHQPDCPTAAPGVSISVEKKSNLTNEPLWSVYPTRANPAALKHLHIYRAPPGFGRNLANGTNAAPKRALARAAVERARKARNRVRRLNAGVERAIGPTEIQRRITLRDEALDALKQSLRNLRSLRLVSPDDTEVAKLTADIRKTLQRSGGLG